MILCIYKPSEKSRFELLLEIGKLLYSEYRFKWPQLNWWKDEQFTQYLRKFNEDVGLNSDRRWMLNELLKLTKNIEGDTAECGVYLGASSYLICQSNEMSQLSKTHFGFDSFEGLSKPKAEDGHYWKEGDLSVSIQMCKSNLSEFSSVELIKGWIPSGFKKVADRKFSFVHIDVDIYQPTKDSIEFFYSRLNPGGVFLCDDYGFSTCPGVKQALDEFLADKNEKMIILPDGGGFFIKNIIYSI